ncbi:hypothetical protein SODALDRAFT_324374 [Sodiomyces alkalinus F11]|uniref:Uncharacterized protein n=1 Tax=Sodiomyces alkalinus (strain CBS 110278 / VKM F-3762 / F11) TaxID=1314773 RepID=A0A3N2PTQ7_SODAK|nr:hypothetical protein SODALDRAFT_324374 [Sodiomyces alkalinus F11]ROT37899.1 hypothetical protein SODALDRAFT_324374 [Sodiomyces alkalinus F11]
MDGIHGIDVTPAGQRQATYEYGYVHAKRDELAAASESNKHIDLDNAAGIGPQLPFLDLSGKKRKAVRQVQPLFEDILTDGSPTKYTTRYMLRRWGRRCWRSGSETFQLPPSPQLNHLRELPALPINLTTGLGTKSCLDGTFLPCSPWRNLRYCPNYLRYIIVMCLYEEVRNTEPPSMSSYGEAETPSRK